MKLKRLGSSINRSISRMGASFGRLLAKVLKVTLAAAAGSFLLLVLDVLLLRDARRSSRP